MLQMLLRRREQGEKLSPAERRDAAWLWRYGEELCCTGTELVRAFNQDTSIKLEGDAATRFVTTIRDLEARGCLDPWEADEIIERTVWIEDSGSCQQGDIGGSEPLPARVGVA